MVFDPTTETWIKNSLPTAQKGRSVGVITKILESNEDGKPQGGLFINTNKTRVQSKPINVKRGANKGAYSFGHVIPWHNTELFSHLSVVRDRQVRYDPDVARGLDFGSGSSTQNYRKRRKKASKILFLVSISENLNHPIEAIDVKQYFDLLLDEAGKRLSEDEGRQVDLSNMFTLHSLRVGGITAFLKAGVPLSGVLTEFIAGHASVIMNFYYQVFAATEVDSIIKQAADKLDSGEMVERVIFSNV